MSAARPPICVVVCTLDPDPDRLERVLAAIEGQSLDREEFDVLIVDNRSRPTVSSLAPAAARADRMRFVEEPRPGLAFARLRAISSTEHPVICFVDDDNVLSKDYLQTALKIAAAEPTLGVWGGRCRAVTARSPGPIGRYFLPRLGHKDEGDEPLTASAPRWSPAEPIGAGLCVRREVAEAYREVMATNELAQMLGRSGDGLMSGEDSLISRIASACGLSHGYRPALELDHLIAPHRLSPGYLARLMTGYGRSSLVLDILSGADPPAAAPSSAWALAINLARRLRGEGPLAAAALMWWDLGRMKQQRLLRPMMSKAEAYSLVSPSDT